MNRLNSIYSVTIVTTLASGQDKRANMAAADTDVKSKLPKVTGEEMWSCASSLL